MLFPAADWLRLTAPAPIAPTRSVRWRLSMMELAETRALSPAKRIDGGHWMPLRAG